MPVITGGNSGPVRGLPTFYHMKVKRHSKSLFFSGPIVLRVKLKLKYVITRYEHTRAQKSRHSVLVKHLIFFDHVGPEEVFNDGSPKELEIYFDCLGRNQT